MTARRTVSRVATTGELLEALDRAGGSIAGLPGSINAPRVLDSARWVLAARDLDHGGEAQYLLTRPGGTRVRLVLFDHGRADTPYEADLENIEAAADRRQQTGRMRALGIVAGVAGVALAILAWRFL